MKGGGILVFVFIVVFIFLFICAIWGISTIVGGVGRALQRKPATKPARSTPPATQPAAPAPALAPAQTSPPLPTTTSTATESPDAATRLLEQLQKAGDLHQQGVLTSEEFSLLKTKLISEF